ncbi:MAG TPA: hypothetical protein PK870_11155, partial [Clostridia bacterium]|nr:hypothetical protein [Clostridia bacterium]
HVSIYCVYVKRFFLRITKHLFPIFDVPNKLGIVILLYIVIHKNTDRYYHAYSYDTDIEDHFGL